MIIHESDLKKAADLLAKSEKALGYRLTHNVADLFCDNFNDWSVEKAMEVKKGLLASGGAGAYYLAEARERYER